MGWAVGFDRHHDRFRGYGVPAYCDAKGCDEEIDRGLGYVTHPAPPENLSDDDYDAWWDEQDDLADGALFVCSKHAHRDVDTDALPAEHPDWLRHVLSDESWQKWRDENPEKAARYAEQLEATEAP